MYNVSAGFLTNIKDSLVLKKARVVVGSTTITEENIVNLNIEYNFGTGYKPAIGTVAAAQLTAELINSDTFTLPSFVGQSIKPAVAILVGASYEWVELGEFFAEENDITISPDGLTTTLTCFDKLATLDRYTYSTSLTFPATFASVVSDIATNYSLSFETQTLPSVTLNNKPAGTVRQVLSELASLITCNVTMSRSSSSNIGKLKFVFSNNIGYAVLPDDYFYLDLLTEDQINVSRLYLQNTSLFSGASGDYSLVFSNSNIDNQTDLDTVYNRKFPFSYYPYEISTLGFPQLEVGDTLSVTDTNLDVKLLYIFQHNFIYDGGFQSTFKAEVADNVTYSSVQDGGSTVNNSINNATSLITGNKGGYITTILNSEGKPQELVISDTDDYLTANKIWRWNLSGLGYSNTGYNGTYGLAITNDGAIVADFITAGKISTDNWDLTNFQGVDSKIEIYKGLVISTTQFGTWGGLRPAEYDYYNSELLMGSSEYEGFSPYQSISFSELLGRTPIISARSFSTTSGTSTFVLAELTLQGTQSYLWYTTATPLRVKNLNDNYNGSFITYNSTLGTTTTKVTYKIASTVSSVSGNTNSYVFYQNSMLEFNNTGLQYFTRQSAYQDITFNTQAVSSLNLGEGNFNLNAYILDNITLEDISTGYVNAAYTTVSGLYNLDFFAGTTLSVLAQTVSMQSNVVLPSTKSISIGGMTYQGGAIGHIIQTDTSGQLDIRPYQILRIGRGTTNSAFAVQIYKGNNTADINHLFFGSGTSYMSMFGNLGIGTTSPTEKLEVNGNLKSARYISTQATGTAPFTIASTTLNTNLNADLLDGYNAGNTSGSVAINNGTLNVNLNADLLDGLNSGNASGNIPISNGTLNTNLNAQFLSGYGHAGIAGSKFLTLYAGGTVNTTLTTYTDIPSSIFLFEQEYDFNNRTVTFEVVISTTTGITGNYRIVTSGGTVVTTISNTATSPTRFRSSAINLTDGTTYKVQFASGTSGQTVSIQAARIVIL